VSELNLPERPDAAQETRIGVDEWVAQVEERRQRAHGFGWIARGWDSLSPAGRLALFVVPAALFPLVATGGNLFRYGIFTILYALLALGLNVTVGFAGLLDLGYVAFFGIGAYGYGILASPQFDNHWPAEAAVPVVVAFTALVGLLVGSSSRRLQGDYLAIVTLFFGQAFVIFVNNADRISFPHWGRVDLTGSTNGINSIDPLDIFGLKITTYREYYYVVLIAFVVVVTLLHFVSESRTGRSWKALREDPLAAEMMSIPVKRQKLLAFTFGAAIAGLTGTIFAALVTGAFPGDYDIGLLITIYAIVILGGAGSLAGCILGALVINVVPELLRSSTNAHWLFYGVLIAGLLLRVRPWRRLAALVVGVVAFGFAVRGIADLVWSRGTAGSAGGGFIGRIVDHWVLIPTHPEQIGNWAYVLLIAGILVVTQLRGIRRDLVLVPVLYLGTFVWENRLIYEVAGATRLILLGALLVLLMNLRPQGLLGTARVEIV
jgi:ABC-type branched-subunit amino acid transport system permease subunit